MLTFSIYVGAQSLTYNAAKGTYILKLTVNTKEIKQKVIIQ
jgi:hypothetical protein